MLRGYSVLHRLVLPKRNQRSQSIYFGINFWIYKHFYLGYIAQAEVGAEGPERTGGTENPLARRLARYSRSLTASRARATLPQNGRV